MKTKEREITNEMREVFEHYISKGIIKHRGINKKIAIKLKLRLEEYTADELKQAIDNYDELLKDETYYFNYKFGLDRLLFSDEVAKLLKGGEKRENYLMHKNKIKASQQQTTEKEFSIDETLELKEINKLYNKYLNKVKKLRYEDYLKSDHWKNFKQKAIQNANYKCQLCGNKEEKLSVHHNNYKNKGKETFDDVVVLCDKCHKKFHNIESD